MMETDGFFEDRRSWWNERYSSEPKSVCDDAGWLEKHIVSVPPGSKVLDLGCGAGGTAAYLSAKGFSVVAADIADKAIAHLRQKLPSAEATVMDMTGPFPFEDVSFGCVVADLCLHYFDFDTTARIIREIRRVLLPGGLLTGRVNSVKDRVHGFGRGREVQRNFFLSNGHYKRFFEPEELPGFLEGFSDVGIGEDSTRTFSGMKFILEFSARKSGRTHGV